MQWKENFRQQQQQKIIVVITHYCESDNSSTILISSTLTAEAQWVESYRLELVHSNYFFKYHIRKIDWKIFLIFKAKFSYKSKFAGYVQISKIKVQYKYVSQIWPTFLSSLIIRIKYHLLTDSAKFRTDKMCFK